MTLTSIADDQIANDAALLAAAIAANGGSAVLAAGASVTFTYTSDAPLDLDAPDTVVNTVTVNATDDEANTATGSDTATVVAADVLPTLLVTKPVDADGVAGFSDSETINEGTPTTATYQVTIENTGVEDVTLTSIADDQIANDAALLAAAIAANGGSAVLAAGDSVTFTYTSDAPLDLDAPDTVVNTVTVNATDDEANTATGSDTATVVAADVLPTLLVTKLVDADGVAGFSDSETINEGTPTTATYQVTIENTGVEDVTLTSIADDQIANDAALLAAAIAANGGSAVLAAGDSVTFTYTSDAPLDLDAPATVVNTVTVNATDDEANTATGSDTATVVAADVQPTLLVTKLVDADGVAGFSDSETINEGTPTTATYQVTIENTGVEDVTLTSIADDQIANDAALLAAAIAANGGSAVLAAGDSVTFTYTSDAPLDLDAPATVVNTVTVNATDDEANTATGSDTATVVAADVLPTLLVTKLVDADGVAGFSDSETINEGTPTTATYQVTIENTGVEDVTLTSIADDQIANDAALLAAAIAANGGSAVLAAGDSVTFTYTSDAPLDLDAPATVVNTVTVNATDDEANTATGSDTATVVAADVPPTLLVTKLVDADGVAGFSDSETINEGTPTTATYQVTIENTGVEDVTLTSIADDQIANDAALLAAAIAANGGSAVLAAGDSVTFTYTSDAPLDLDAPATVVNTVTVNATDDEANTATGSDTATVVAADVQPTLLVTKLVDADGVAGFSDSETINEGTPTTATYQVTIENTGVEDVTLTSIADDQIANDAALLAAAIAANGGSAVLAAGDSVTFTYTSDAPLDLDAPATVVNTVTVNATDDEANTATGSDTATVVAADVQPTLLVTKLVDADGVAGFSDSETINEGTPTTATYQVTIENTGVEDVTLTSIADDQIANDAALLAAAIAANGGSAVLAAGDSVTFTYTSDAPLDLDAPATVVNTVTVNATDDEANTATGSDTATVVAADVQPTLLVTKLVDADGVAGFSDSETINEGTPTTATYQVTIENTGVEDVTLTSIADDQIANDAALLAAAIAANGGSAVLAAGDSVTFTYTSDAPLDLDAPATVVNTVTVNATDDEANTATGSDTATVVAADVLPTLLVTKLVDADGVAGFSDSETINEGTPTTATYQVTIENTGVEDVTLTSIADDQIANDAALLAAAIAANGGSAVLAAGDSVTFTYTSDAPLDLDAPATVVNTVTVNATDDEANTATGSDTATVVAADVLPTLLVTKLVDADGVAGFSDSETINEGTPTTATYQVTIENTGVEDVTLTSIADDQIANDAALLAAAIAANGGSAVLAAGDSVTFTYTSDAPLDLDAPATVVNTVTVNATDDEANTATGSDTATVVAADVLPTLLVTKLVDADGVAGFSDSETINEGTPTTATYQVTIENTGVEDVTLTSIADDQIANDAALLAAAIAANGGSAVLAAGDSVTFTYTSDAPLDLDAPATVVNTVTVNATDDEANTATGSDTATVVAADVLPTLLVTKLVDADGVAGFNDSETINEGTPTTATYQVTIENTGVEAVTLTSIADDQIANDAALLAAAIAANGGSAVLAAGASVIFTYTSDAPLDLDAPATVVNTVTVNATDDEANTATGSDTATVVAADVLPTLLVTKLVDADGVAGFSDSETINEGTPTTATYQVTIENTGVEA